MEWEKITIGAKQEHLCVSEEAEKDSRLKVLKKTEIAYTCSTRQHQSRERQNTMVSMTTQETIDSRLPLSNNSPTISLCDSQL
ncbi:hypothetical protein QQF64_032182 [Cirrhinus molitorella]|uniref:Uncharacterized protein n=1 Tax=Cirrhinus molitorella TaxID=172907 RepID=A0ABR3MZ45_9TELE